MKIWLSTCPVPLQCWNPTCAHLPPCFLHFFASFDGVLPNFVLYVNDMYATRCFCLRAGRKGPVSLHLTRLVIGRPSGKLCTCANPHQSLLHAWHSPLPLPSGICSKRTLEPKYRAAPEHHLRVAQSARTPVGIPALSFPVFFRVCFLLVFLGARPGAAGVPCVLLLLIDHQRSPTCFLRRRWLSQAFLGASGRATYLSFHPLVVEASFETPITAQT